MEWNSSRDRKTGRSGMNPFRLLWFVIWLCAVILAALGVMLPLLPTTPFLLVAVYAFARSSDRWHAWLLSHRVFGPIINDWREHGAINPRTKTVGVASMAAVFGISLAIGVDAVILAVQAIVLSASATFVLSRPSPPEFTTETKPPA
ncbi:MAG: YbaN family protein [Paracoccaceae bacterium]|nr:YbaN family protein [Paracoccaceae bacterium]